MVDANGRHRPLLWIFLGFVGHLVALLLFDVGMFPVKQMRSDRAEWTDYGLEPGSNLPLRFEPVFKKVVVLLIDGIRADFVWNEKKLMPFTRSLLDSGRGLGFVTLAHAPTVTLPRIKAILTGSVPVFSDAILNLQQSSALQEDNLLSYAKRHHGASIVAYGDDIWGTLFPQADAFLRSEWVVSFFVSDFVDVDLNVTRHVSSELERSDWDILILHYLGLDHIGHFEGPTSSHVPAKLLEMDGVVEEVYRTLDDDSLLLVLGDHGTGDAGGHGGSSAAEVRTPAMFFSPRLDGGEAAAAIPGVPVADVDQIDLASTLAVLLAVPIPKSNMGKLISPLLSPLFAGRPLELLRCFAANTVQLLDAVNGSAVPGAQKERFFSQHSSLRSLHGAYTMRHLERSGGASPAFDASHVADLLDGYRSLLHEAGFALVRSSVLYDAPAIAAGLSLLVSIVVLCGVYLRWPGAFAVLSVGPVLIVSGSLSAFVHVFVCTSPSLPQSAWICSLSVLSAPVIVLFFAVSVLNIACVFAVSKCLWESREAFSCAAAVVALPARVPSGRTCALAAGAAFHLLCLSASSFVEEEHQIWYFLTTSLVLGLGIQRCVQDSAAVARHMASADAHSFLPFGVSLVLLRATRSWCQTGDKWLHLPDVSSWLADDRRLALRTALGGVSLAAVGCVFVFKYRRRHVRPWCLAFLLPGLLFVFVARCAMGSFLPVPPPLAAWLSHDGYVESHVVYGVFGALLLAESGRSALRLAVRRGGGGGGDDDDGNGRHAAAPGLQTFYCAYLLLMCLISRAQNVPVVCALAVQHVVFDAHVWPRMPAWQVAVSSLWMGFAGFYMQGNSNAMAKIDLTAGYVGMRDFSPPRVLLLITLSVWASLLLWVLAAFAHVWRRRSAVRRDEESVHGPVGAAAATAAVDADVDAGDAVSKFLSTGMFYQMLIATVAALVTTLMRQHIMVWTVFSPKLLYATSQSFHLLCLVTAMMLSEFLSSVIHT